MGGGETQTSHPLSLHQKEPSKRESGIAGDKRWKTERSERKGGQRRNLGANHEIGERKLARAFGRGRCSYIGISKGRVRTGKGRKRE